MKKSKIIYQGRTLRDLGDRFVVKCQMWKMSQRFNDKGQRCAVNFTCPNCGYTISHSDLDTLNTGMAMFEAPPEYCPSCRKKLYTGMQNNAQECLNTLFQVLLPHYLLPSNHTAFADNLKLTQLILDTYVNKSRSARKQIGKMEAADARRQELEHENSQKLYAYAQRCKYEYDKRLHTKAEPVPTPTPTPKPNLTCTDTAPQNFKKADEDTKRAMDDMTPEQIKAIADDFRNAE